MTGKQSKLLIFLYELRWVAVSLILVCAVWFENESLIKNNLREIKEINMEINIIDKTLDKEIRGIDDRIDDNSSDIKILKERIKYKSQGH